MFGWVDEALKEKFFCEEDLTLEETKLAAMCLIPSVKEAHARA